MMCKHHFWMGIFINLRLIASLEFPKSTSRCSLLGIIDWSLTIKERSEFHYRFFKTVDTFKVFVNFWVRIQLMVSSVILKISKEDRRTSESIRSECQLLILSWLSQPDNLKTQPSSCLFGELLFTYWFLVSVQIQLLSLNPWLSMLVLYLLASSLPFVTGQRKDNTLSSKRKSTPKKLLFTEVHITAQFLSQSINWSSATSLMLTKEIEFQLTAFSLMKWTSPLTKVYIIPKIHALKRNNLLPL